MIVQAGNTTEQYCIHAGHMGRPEAVTDAAKTVRWRANNLAFYRTVGLDTLPMPRCVIVLHGY